jgi:type II secretory ATPase GspE/PulE/Tfp pilus assembly ATPase PilB-like protein
MMRTHQNSPAVWLNESLINQSFGLMNLDDKPVLDSVKLLFDQMQSGYQKLSNRMCPVRLACGLGQVWVLSEYVHDDQAKALALAIAQLGIVLAQPARLVVPPATLSELSRRLQHATASRVNVGMTASTPKHVLMSLLDDLIVHALNSDASDIHLTLRHDRQWAEIMYTINGLCVRPEKFSKLSVQMVHELLAVSWMTMQGGNGAVFDATCEQQGRFERQIGKSMIALRWASLVLQSGVSVCWRVLNRLRWQQPPSLDGLGYSPTQQQRLRRATQTDAGLVVFAGLVGSGKSTSLAALMQLIRPSHKIITLEDPVEYVIPNALQCAVAGFEAQAASKQLASKLKTIKRSAAHDVLIGELRDTLGGQAVVDLVLAGTRVYTTVHASSALHILTRLGSSLIGIPASLLTMPGFLKLLVYQTLVRRLCSHCGLDSTAWLAEPTPGATGRMSVSSKQRQVWLEQVHPMIGGEIRTWRFRNLEGCQRCRSAEHAQNMGYDARLLVAEVIEPAAVADFYRALATRELAAQVALWQESLSNGQPVLTGYEPVGVSARSFVHRGQLDPREYLMRFAPTHWSGVGSEHGLV